MQREKILIIGLLLINPIITFAFSNTFKITLPIQILNKPACPANTQCSVGYDVELFDTSNVGKYFTPSEYGTINLYDSIINPSAGTIYRNHLVTLLDKSTYKTGCVLFIKNTYNFTSSTQLSGFSSAASLLENTGHCNLTYFQGSDTMSFSGEQLSSFFQGKTFTPSQLTPVDGNYTYSYKFENVILSYQNESGINYN